MQVSIHDREALSAISPAALSAYARMAGWRRHDMYRDHSVIYVGDTLPEIIVPGTARLGDYASAVSALIGTFTQVSDQDEVAVYRALVKADRDEIGVRVADADDGSLGLNDGVDLVAGARDMVLSAACSLHETRPVYRAGANREAEDLLRSMRLGQSARGSFVVTLLTPVVPPPIPDLSAEPAERDAPIARQMTERLAEALTGARRAAERTVAGEAGAFGAAVSSGVSANLCEALARMIEPFSTLDIRVSWALTRPMSVPGIVRFGRADAALLREAARSFRACAPRPDLRLQGFVRIPERGGEDAAGAIRIRTEIDGKLQSVTAVLAQTDHARAVQAHRDRLPVVLTGDLERFGQRWRLLHARLEGVLRDDGHDLAGG